MKLKKVSKKLRLKKKTVEKEVSVFSPNYSGEYNSKGFINFPYKPEMREWEIIDSEEKLKELVEKMRYIPAFAFDTETSGLRVYADNDNFAIADITISWGEDNNYDITVNKLRDEDIDRNIPIDTVVELLKPIFERLDVLIIGANLKFDMHTLARVGISIKTENLFDTQLASWLCDENSPNGLKENSAMKMHISQTHFKEVTDAIPNEVKKQFGYKANAKVKDFRLVSIEEGHKYCLEDAFFTWCLALGFMQELVDEKMEDIYYKKMIPFMRVLFDMEEKGITVDVDRLQEMQVEMQEDLDQLQYEIYELSGTEFNIGSPAQKSLILFGIDDYTLSFSEYLEKYKKRYAKKIAEKGLDLDKVKKSYEDKQNDPDRIRILNHCFNFSPIAYTDTGNPSTDSDAIWRISRLNPRERRKKEGVEMCDLLLSYSKLSKLKTAFADGILEQLYPDGKCHTNFNQTGTDSGRLSSSQPNLQQLPKAEEEDKYQIRSVFIGSLYYETEEGMCYDTIEDAEADGYDEDDLEPKRKKIIALDYHNLEMVCLTHFSHDKNLSEMFANDDDAHGSTAVNMFNLPCTPVECKKEYPHLRQAAKTINFLLMYGGGASLLYEKLASDHFTPIDLGSKEYLSEYKCRNGKEVAQKFIDKYFESYSGVAEFIRSQKRFAHKNKYVYTILGRKRRLPDINSSDSEKSSYCERLSVNSAIQGTAGDITSSAQIRIFREELSKKYLCHMLLQVHDELVFECPERYLEECIEVIKYDMEHPFGDKESQQVKYLRADYDTGDSYQEAK